MSSYFMLLLLIFVVAVNGTYYQFHGILNDRKDRADITITTDSSSENEQFTTSKDKIYIGKKEFQFEHPPPESPFSCFKMIAGDHINSYYDVHHILQQITAEYNNWYRGGGNTFIKIGKKRIVKRGERRAGRAGATGAKKKKKKIKIIGPESLELAVPEPGAVAVAIKSGVDEPGAAKPGVVKPAGTAIHKKHGILHFVGQCSEEDEVPDVCKLEFSPKAYVFHPDGTETISIKNEQWQFKGQKKWSNIKNKKDMKSYSIRYILKRLERAYDKGKFIKIGTATISGLGQQAAISQLEFGAPASPEEGGISRALPQHKGALGAAPPALPQRALPQRALPKPALLQSVTKAGESAPLAPAEGGVIDFEAPTAGHGPWPSGHTPSGDTTGGNDVAHSEYYNNYYEDGQRQSVGIVNDINNIHTIFMIELTMMVATIVIICVCCCLLCIVAIYLLTSGQIKKPNYNDIETIYN